MKIIVLNMVAFIRGMRQTKLALQVGICRLNLNLKLWLPQPVENF